MKKLFFLIVAFFTAMTMNAQEAISVDSALVLGNALDSAATSAQEYTIQGYVLNAQAYSTSYNNQNWYMADSANATSSNFQAFACVAIEDGDTLKVLNGDKVELKGKLLKYWDKNKSKFIIEVKNGVATFIAKAEGDHTIIKCGQADTVSVSDALGLINAGDPCPHIVEGIISQIDSTYLNKGNINVTLKDLSDPAKTILAYSMIKAKGVNFTSPLPIKVNDTIQVYGKTLKMYKSKPELADEVYLSAIVGVAPIDTTVVPVDTTDAVAPAADTLQAALMAKGKANSYDDVKVNGGQAIKMGKSGAGGDMTITVGRGTTKLCFYAAGWNKEDGSVTITAPEGVTITPATIDVVANSVFQGTGKSFTVSNENDHAFAFSIEGADDQVVTFTLTSTKRCFVWGATYGMGAIVAAPNFLPEESSFMDSVQISISAEEGARIYYTLDETDPTVESTEYVAPFTLTQSTLVKAVAVIGEDLSMVASKQYSKLDTVSVTEARALIDAKDAGVHFVKGVVIGKVFDSNKFSAEGKLSFWMTDEQNPGDSLEAYNILGPDNERWESVQAANDLIGEGDTVLVYASKLSLYTAKKYYEADGGYFVQVLGKYVEDPTIVYDTLNVAEAKAICDTLGNNGTSNTKYYIEGYAVYADAYDAIRANQIFFMVDDPAAPDSLFEAYAATPMKDSVAYPVLNGDKVRVFGRMKKYVDSKNHVQLEVMEPTVEFLEEVEGDRMIEIPTVDTITVARALAIGDSIGQGKTTSEMYVVDGYVIDAEAFHQTNKNQTWTMADEADAASATFKAYRCVPMNGTDTLKVLKGDKVRICGAIQNYNGTIEISYVKAEFLSMVEGDHSYADKPQEKVDTITVARALEIGEALAAGKSSDSIYVIAGFVSKIISDYDSVSKNESFWMIDTIRGRAASNAEGAFEVYRGKMDTIAEQDAMVYVTAKIYKYQPSSGNPVIETANSPIPEVHVAVAGHAENIDTITVARALEIGQALADGKVSGDKYCITGYVSAIEEMYSSYGNETFWITDEKGLRTADKTQAFEVYRGKPNTGAEIGFDAKIQITCYIKNFSGTIENDGNNVPFEVLEQGSPIQIDTISVAQAIEETGKLPTGEKSPGFYAVKGYIASTSVDSKQKISFYLCDDITEPNTDFQCYRPNFDKADSAKVAAGSYVLVVGKLDNNSHGKQMAQGAAVTFLEAPKIDTLHVTVAQAEEVIAELAEDEVTKAFYIVTGYVVNPQEVEDEIQSFFLSDDAQATQASFYVEGLEVEEALIAGQSVEILGKLKKYKNPFAETIQSRLVNGQILSIEQQGIEQIVLTEKAMKVVVDGHVYIIRDNKLFNLQGARVR